MKKLLTMLAMMSSTVFAGGTAPDIVIEGIFDGPQSGGIPKLVEIYVVTGGDIALCGIGSATNGNPSSGQDFAFTGGNVTAGQHLYVATEIPGFTAYFGFAPTWTDNSVNINGDDAIELFCNGSVVDTYGVVGTDGTDEVWEHLDGWAHRNNIENPVTRGGRVFDPANWTFSGVDATDGCGGGTNAACGSVYPIGALPVELQSFSVE